MENKILSVTVPAYNVGEFLRKGIPTFLDPQILNDIEIIIVDDGSQDKTADIADEYKKNYPGTIEVVHKQNGGHGSAINTGVKTATGTYFMVVDADDWVNTENFVKLVMQLKSCSTDLVLTNAIKVNSNGKLIGYEKIKKMPNGKAVQIKDYIGRINNIEMHNYCIKTELLRTHNVRCHEHHFYVDQEYVLYSLLHCVNVTYYDLIVYNYLIGRDGQSVAIESKRKNIDQYYEVVWFLVKFYNQNKQLMQESFRHHYRIKIAWFLRAIYSTAMSYNTPEKKQELINFDKLLFKRSRDIYYANRNLCIFLLRITQFHVYKIVSVVYRAIYKVKK